MIYNSGHHELPAVGSVTVSEVEERPRWRLRGLRKSLLYAGGHEFIRGTASFTASHATRSSETCANGGD